MQIIRGMINLKHEHRGVVVTIGNFDGIHKGHQALITKLKHKADQLNRPTMVIIFEPQPNEFFVPDQAAGRLMNFREKVQGLKRLGVNYVLCLKFNATFAMLTAEQFVSELLVKKLAVPYVLVGDDFRFGAKRQGDFDLLERLGGEFNYEANCMATFNLLGARVSSTRIRESLQLGKLEVAQELLGKSYEMHGKIAHGDKRGRLLGFPTANIKLHRKRVPLSGVFVVKVAGIRDYALPGVANIGTRPTMSGDTRTLLEVHLLDFNENIYGHRVDIQFLHKLRDEHRFESIELLSAQIHEDIAATRRYFENVI